MNELKKQGTTSTVHTNDSSTVHTNDTPPGETCTKPKLRHRPLDSASASDDELWNYINICGNKAVAWRDRFIAVLPEVVARRVFQRSGENDPVVFAAKTAGISHHMYTRVMRLNRWLESFPVLHRLFQCNTVGWTKLEILVGKIDHDEEQRWVHIVTTSSRRTIERIIREKQMTNGSAQSGIDPAHGALDRHGNASEHPQSGSTSRHDQPGNNSDHHQSASRSDLAPSGSASRHDQPASGNPDSSCPPVRLLGEDQLIGLLPSERTRRGRKPSHCTCGYEGVAEELQGLGWSQEFIEWVLAGRHSTPRAVPVFVDAIDAERMFRHAKKLGRSSPTRRPLSFAGVTAYLNDHLDHEADSRLRYHEVVTHEVSTGRRYLNTSAGELTLTAKDEARFVRDGEPIDLSEAHRTAKNAAASYLRTRRTQNRRVGRHLPNPVKRFLRLRFGGICAVENCHNHASHIHHLRRFALNPDPDPDFLVPLCNGCGNLAHVGALDEERWITRSAIHRLPEKTCLKFRMPDSPSSHRDRAVQRVDAQTAVHRSGHRTGDRTGARRIDDHAPAARSNHLSNPPASGQVPNPSSMAQETDPTLSNPLSSTKSR